MVFLWLGISVAVALGIGNCQPDEISQIETYNKACDRGDMEGCFKAVRLYRQACDEDEGEGCLNLGLMYRSGENVFQDDTEAARLFRQACDLGNKGGCFLFEQEYRSRIPVNR